MRVGFALLSLASFISSAAPTALSQCKYTTFTEIVVTTAGSTLMLPANGARHCLLIVNKGAQTVYVTKASGGGATEGVPIPALGNWEPFVPFIDPVYVRSSSGSQNVLVAEGQ